MKRVLWLAIHAAVALLIAAGCKTYPNGPTAPTEVSVGGGYVGSGTLDGSTANIRLRIAGPDTLGHYSGDIDYLSQDIALASATKDSSGDTIRFQYTRSNVLHAAWAAVDGSGLTVHYTAPTGISAIRLNRGFGTDTLNLTGIWQGTMFSYGLLTNRTASMTIDQEGGLFGGTLDVTLDRAAHVQVTSGGYSGNSFQFTGTMRYGTTDYSFSAAGSYVTVDSVSGNWSAGDFGSLDHGSFDFRRPFQ